MSENPNVEPPWYKSPVALSIAALLTFTGSTIGVLKYINDLKSGYEQEVADRTTASIAARDVALDAARGAAAAEILDSLLFKIEEAYEFSQCWGPGTCENQPSELPVDREQNRQLAELANEIRINRQFRREHCQDHRDKGDRDRECTEL